MMSGLSIRRAAASVRLSHTLRLHVDPVLIPASAGDGLRHFAYQEEQIFYNGVTMEDIHGEHRTNVNGIHGKSSWPPLPGRTLRWAGPSHVAVVASP